MSAKRYVLVLLAVAAAGAGGGYAAGLVFPQDDAAVAPESADRADGRAADARGAAQESAVGESGAGAGGAAPAAGARGGAGDVDAAMEQVVAQMPPEMREEFENDPELQAQMRAQLRTAIESGQLPAGALGGDGGAAAGGAGGADAGASAGGRNTQPLSGEIVSYADGALVLATEEGDAEIAVAPDTPVTLASTVGESPDALAPGAQLAIVAQPDETGALAAAVVVAGESAQGQRGLGAARRFGAAVAGTVASYADGVLVVEGEEGAVEIAVADDTPLQVATTASEAGAALAAGETATAFVQRDAEGGLTAASVSVGSGAGFGEGLRGGGAGAGGARSGG